jgi:hypothetical protein
MWPSPARWKVSRDSLPSLKPPTRGTASSANGLRTRFTPSRRDDDRVRCGAVAEWSKALAWKVSIRQNRIEGSNPSRSASPRRTVGARPIRAVRSLARRNAGNAFSTNRRKENSPERPPPGDPDCVGECPSAACSDLRAISSIFKETSVYIDEMGGGCQRKGPAGNQAKVSDPDSGIWAELSLSPEETGYGDEVSRAYLIPAAKRFCAGAAWSI